MSTTTGPTPLHELGGTFTLDPAHSRIGFVARHAMVTKVRGQFGEVEGTIALDAHDFSRSTISIDIGVASIDTRNAQRDAHLRESDFLDAAQFPRITFVADTVRLVDQTTLELLGDLTIKGLTRRLVVPFEYGGSTLDPFGNLRLGFEGGTQINRHDYGITWNAALETGGVLIGDRIGLELDVAVVQPA